MAGQITHISRLLSFGRTPYLTFSAVFAPQLDSAIVFDSRIKRVSAIAGMDRVVSKQSSTMFEGSSTIRTRGFGGEGLMIGDAGHF
jgi:hypothetical protein